MYINKKIKKCRTIGSADELASVRIQMGRVLSGRNCRLRSAKNRDTPKDRRTSGVKRWTPGEGNINVEWWRSSKIRRRRPTLKTRSGCGPGAVLIRSEGKKSPAFKIRT